MSKEKLSEQDAQRIKIVVNNLMQYMEMTREIVAPIDELAYQTITNIVTMSLISFGRKYGFDYCESEFAKIDNDKEQDINDIVNEVNKELKD